MSITKTKIWWRLCARITKQTCIWMDLLISNPQWPRIRLSCSVISSLKGWTCSNLQCLWTWGRFILLNPSLKKQKICNYSYIYSLVKASEIKITTKLKYRLAIVFMNLAEVDKSKLYFNEALSEDPSLVSEINQNMAKLR